MILVADTNVMVDFLDGVIEDPYALVHPYQMILISPVTFQELLRAYPEKEQDYLAAHLKETTLPPPSLEHWIETARVLRKLYSKRNKSNIARMQNDVLIALAARDANAPLWSRDADLEEICDELGVGLINC